MSDTRCNNTSFIIKSYSLNNYLHLISSDVSTLIERVNKYDDDDM